MLPDIYGDGTLRGGVKEKYSVGEKVQVDCAKGQEPQQGFSEARCLGNGYFDVGKLVCLRGIC